MRAPRQLRSDLHIALIFALAFGAFAIACGSGVPQTLEAPPLTPQNRELYARINLQKARALYAEGRLDMAASAARRGLGFEPDSAELHKIRADALEALGETDKARVHRTRADELAPPTPPPVAEPHPLAETGADVLFVLLPPAPELRESPGSRSRVPQNWPLGEEAATLVERVRVRLPHVSREVVPIEDHPADRDVPSARAWLEAPGTPDALVTLRVDRAFCGRSVKDGEYSVAWLRVGVVRPGVAEADAHLIRVTLDEVAQTGCKAAALAVALERTLELDSVRNALAAPPADAAGSDGLWSSSALRVAFPAMDWKVQQEIQQGRRYFSLGELTLALEHFQAATRIDPEDPFALAFVDDTERSIELARLLEPIERAEAEVELRAGVGDEAAPRVSAVSSRPPDRPAEGHLAAQLSHSQRVGLEAQLEHEQRRRQEMLSALAVLYETRNAPTLGTVANMRVGEVNDPTATGVALALPRTPAGSAVEVRTLYAPDGDVLARYYFAEGSEAPVLREEDASGDGVPDRWVGYVAGVVSEVWESETPGAPPSLHLMYGSGGTPIERVELDHDSDGRLDRLFVYASGRLVEESWDTNGDGAFDRFQTFDASGSLTLREEDVDGDEEIDVRTAYREGRIIRREILNEALLNEMLASEIQ